MCWFVVLLRLSLHNLQLQMVKLCAPLWEVSLTKLPLASHFPFFHVGKENYEHVLFSGNLPAWGENSPKTVRKWLFLQ